MAYEFFGAGAASPMISKYFSLGDMTVTSQKSANIPNALEKANLVTLGKVFDFLYEKIGPFRIESAFRSQAVQDELKAGGGGADAAAQAAVKSYHSLGIAADIQPTTMSAEAYFAKIASNPAFQNMLGEIALKKNVLHLSLPTATKKGVLMYVNSANQYIRYKADEVAAIISKYRKPIAIGSVLLLVGSLAALFYLRSRRQP